MRRSFIVLRFISDAPGPPLRFSLVALRNYIVQATVFHLASVFTVPPVTLVSSEIYLFFLHNTQLPQTFQCLQKRSLLPWLPTTSTSSLPSISKRLKRSHHLCDFIITLFLFPSIGESRSHAVAAATCAAFMQRPAAKKVALGRVDQWARTSFLLRKSFSIMYQDLRRARSGRAGSLPLHD